MRKFFLFTILFFLINILCINNIYCQDIHFSQFYASPLSLNSAETGFLKESWRFANNYRTQWSAIGVPFQTISVSFDKSFTLNNKSGLGIGAMAINDKSGYSNLAVNKLYISASYIRNINITHKFSIAAQVGYIFKSFSLSNLTLPSQFNPATGLFDPDMPNFINDHNENLSYFDINLGGLYSYNIGKIKPYAGISLSHINRPIETFIKDETSRLPMRMVIYGGAKIDLTDNIMLNPNLLSMFHKRAKDWILGAIINFTIPNRILFRSIFAGIHSRAVIRTFDAIIFSAGLNIFGFDIGASYDINISRLRAATKHRGAFEISLIYKNLSKKSYQITIPCDRY